MNEASEVTHVTNERDVPGEMLREHVAARTALVSMLDTLDALNGTQQIQVLRACVSFFSLEPHVRTQRPFVEFEPFETLDEFDPDLPPPTATANAPFTNG